MQLCAGKIVLLVATVAGLCYSQNECPFPVRSDLEGVINATIPDGDNPQTPTVNVMDFHVICLAYGEQQDLLRFVSVVVWYTCTDNDLCPNGTVTEQIETQCVDGEWSNNVQGSTDNIRSEITEASLTTTPREDCSLCLSPERVSSLQVTTESDSVTHCVACDSSCNEGLMRCYGVKDSECCNFYNNSECVDECPSPFVPNSNNTCDCPVGSFGFNCANVVVCNTTDLETLENGNVTVSDNTFDSVATYSCNTGYALVGDATRRCQGDGTWSGSIPTCTADPDKESNDGQLCSSSRISIIVGVAISIIGITRI